ncbi:hypothetical protein F4802DRAFT_541404 [Xylaria palmicola]|nr:hypothetical protein F4802DRAFT_541404 [Xylaria palmicola]
MASAGSAESSTPVPIRRTVSSQSGLHGQGQPAIFNTPSAASSGASIPRWQSTQDRISEILEIGRQRADSMSLHARSPGRSPDMPPVREPPLPDLFDQPNERTTFDVARNAINYQTTQQATLSLRNRQPPPSPGTSSASQNGNEPQGAEEKAHGLWRYLDGFWSIELENKGSVARDHLAVERTFLAWLRTSLAFASIGIGITQLFRLNASLVDEQSTRHFRHLGRPLGTSFIGISILVLLLGYHRFYQPSQWLLKGKFPASRGPIIIITLVAFALMLANLIVVIVA